MKPVVAFLGSTRAKTTRRNRVATARGLRDGIYRVFDVRKVPDTRCGVLEIFGKRRRNDA